MRPEYLDRLQKPWAILVAATYGCNYACWFCGIQKSFNPKDWHHYEYMDPNLVGKIFDECGTWLPHIRAEYLQRGEPTLNPQLAEVFRATKVNRKAFIECHTNGSLLEEWDAFEELTTKWFDAGLNTLVLNGYKRWWGTPKPGYDRYTLWMEYANRYAASHPGVQVVDYYYNNPRHISPHGYGSPTQKMFIVFDDLERMNTVSFSGSKQWQGNVQNIPVSALLRMGKTEVKEPLKERCTRPFREMSVEVNGCVDVCCLDWRRQSILGRVPEMTMQEIWESPAACAQRELVWRRNRNMTPCDRCEWVGTRQGLLKPIDMPGTDEELLAIVEKNARRWLSLVHPSAEIKVGGKILKPEAPGTYHY